MTEEQSLIFSQVLDTNWQVKELMDANKWLESFEKVKELNALKQKLKESMGSAEYDNFITMGQKMFASSQD
jgi:hypothetical protein